MTKAKEIENIMKSLKCSYDEAVEIWNDDNEINDSNVNDDLTEEQKKNIKKMTNSKDHKRVERKPREKKIDLEKIAIIDFIFSNLKDNYDVSIVKNDGEIALHLNDTEYTVKLIKHRPPKK